MRVYINPSNMDNKFPNRAMIGFNSPSNPSSMFFTSLNFLFDVMLYVTNKTYFSIIIVLYRILT